MQWKQLKKTLFGKPLLIVAGHDDMGLLKKVLKKAGKEAKRLERQIFFFDKKSTLSQLNSKRKLRVEKEFLQALRSCLAMSKKALGIYDITKGKNFLQYRMREKVTELDCSFRDVKIKGRIVKLIHKDVLLDLQSVAKGFVADGVSRVLKKHKISDFVIDCKGDVLVSGRASPVMRIQHPEYHGEAIMTLKPKDSGVSMSADFTGNVDMRDNSFVLHRNDYKAFVVIAPTLFEADLYATVFSVLSKHEIGLMLKEKKDIGVMAIDKANNKHYYNDFKEKASKDV